MPIDHPMRHSPGGAMLFDLLHDRFDWHRALRPVKAGSLSHRLGGAA